MKILVTGCCGYVGSALIVRLLAESNQVIGYDAQWFGDGYLPQGNKNFKLIKGDIRDEKKLAANVYGCDAFIHLAGLTNDKACQLHPELAQSVNVTSLKTVIRATEPIKCRIFLSSAAIYGGETLYAKAKIECEHILQDSSWIILRPGTVCGYAPRMRFDLPVNQMTRDAIIKNQITVNGGDQMRTSLHISDLCARLAFLAGNGRPGSYNINADNLTVLDIAKKVAWLTKAAIRIIDYTDKRDYQMNSDFLVSFHTEDAISDMISKFSTGYWKDALSNPLYMNVLPNEFRDHAIG